MTKKLTYKEISNIFDQTFPITENYSEEIRQEQNTQWLSELKKAGWTDDEWLSELELRLPLDSAILAN